jgi:PleD family two-component response regulator
VGAQTAAHAFTNAQGPHDLMQTGAAPRSQTDYTVMPSKLSKKDMADLIQALCVVVVDDNQHMRKMIRTLLVNCGIKGICEAADGIAALDVIRTVCADVVILDWRCRF